MLNFYSVIGRVDTIVVLIPAIFAAGASIYAGKHMSEWYLQHHDPS